MSDWKREAYRDLFQSTWELATALDCLIYGIGYVFLKPIQKIVDWITG